MSEREREREGGGDRDRDLMVLCEEDVCVI